MFHAKPHQAMWFRSNWIENDYNISGFKWQINVLIKGGHSVIGRGNSVITAAKFGYRDQITKNRQKLPNYRRPKAFPDDLSLGNFSRRLSQKVIFTLNSEDDFRRKSSSLFQCEDDIRRNSSSLFKVKMTFCESHLHSSKLLRDSGRFLADFYRITETETEVLKLTRPITEPTCWLPCPPLVLMKITKNWTSKYYSNCYLDGS